MGMNILKFQHFLLMYGLWFSSVGFAQNEVEPKSIHLWKIIADEVSRALPAGTGSWDGDWSTDRNNPKHRHKEFAATSHIVSFSPTYIAASLVETALTPFVLTGRATAGSSTKSRQEIEAEKNNEKDAEIKRLKEENETLRKKQVELLEKLQNQAERFIDSYNSGSKVGFMEPELRGHLQLARKKIMDSFVVMSTLEGNSVEKIKLDVFNLNKNITDYDLAQKLLNLGEG